MRADRLRRGFTLMEMMIVLLIIAILFGLSMPALHTAFTEQTMRHDSHQLALMVRTAMIQCTEQHRPYVVDLTANSSALHPEGKAKSDSDDDDSSATPSNSATGLVAAVDVDDTPAAAGNMEDVVASNTLDGDDKLQVPDPQKPKGWIDIPPTTWVFHPGQLCPATRIRLTRGEAYIEMNFNALTGNVENETSYIP